MSDPQGLFPPFDLQPAAHDDADPAPSEPALSQPAASDLAPPEPTPAEPDGVGADGFDRGRVLRLLDRLERDVAAVETAMVHVEAGEHEAYAAAVATIDAELVD